MENFDELLECRGHNGLIVEPIQDVVQNSHTTVEGLVGLTTNNTWGPHLRQEALKRLRVFDTGWIIKSEDAENVSRFEADSWLLDQLNDTILRGDKRHVHFHDLDMVLR